MSSDSPDLSPALPPAPRPRRRIALVAGTAAVALGAAGVVAVTAGAPRAAADELSPFADCSALTDWYAAIAADQVGPWGLGGEVMPFAVAESAGDGAGADSAAGAPLPVDSDSAVDEAAAGGARLDAVGTSESGTNVQEDGVDEPAALKTDGEHVIMVSGGDLVVVRLDGAASTEVGRVRVTPTGPSDGTDDTGVEPAVEYPTELLLAGDRVLVLGQGTVPVDTDPPVILPVEPDGGVGDSEQIPADSILPWPGSGAAATTTVTVVDIADPSSPVVVARDEVEGRYLSARATGTGGDTAVRLVLSSTPVLPFLYPGAVPEGATQPLDEAAAEDWNRGVVAGATVEDWLPARVGADGATVPALDCAQVAHPTEGAGIGTVTVLTLDPAVPAGSAVDALVVDADAVTADGENVYASPDRLYVATTTGGWTWTGDGSGDDGPAELRTEVHGFDTTDPDATVYTASGSVDGWLLGRWALSAADGHLRVATTTDPGGTGTAMQSSVHVLAETPDGLAPTGRVDGLGPGESIRAVRWFGDLAVVVTFRQTDPLYTLDLSDPAAPRVTGELKVTGYSAYLHPIGDDRLLGIGQEATLEGMTTGTKAETYDLSDLAVPTAVDSLVWPESSSPVEWDSRQFSYLPDRATAVFGIEEYGPVVPLEPDGGPGTDLGRAVPVGGPGLVAASIDGTGALAEAGRWSAGTLATGRTTADPYGSYGWVTVLGHVVVGDSVAVSTVEYGPDGLPRPRLAVLGVDGLSPLGVVEL